MARKVSQCLLKERKDEKKPERLDSKAPLKEWLTVYFRSRGVCDEAIQRLLIKTCRTKEDDTKELETWVDIVVKRERDRNNPDLADKKFQRWDLKAVDNFLIREWKYTGSQMRSWLFLTDEEEAIIKGVSHSSDVDSCC